MVELNTNSKEYFAKRKRLAKPMNVEKANRKRLKSTSLDDLIKEVYKNCFQYGTDMIINQFPDRIEVFNHMKTAVETMDYLKLYKAWITYDNDDDNTVNFHEGIRTYLLRHSKIETYKTFIETGKSSDGYFQYVADSSHDVVEETGEIIEFNNVKEPVLGWKVTIWFNDEKDPLRSMFIDTLKSFYFDEKFINTFPITLDSKKFEPNIMTYQFLNEEYSCGSLHYTLEFTEKEDDKILLFWKVDKDSLIYHIVANTSFNGKHVKGQVLLTNTSQFANDNRTELSSGPQYTINRFIERLQNANEKKLATQILLKKAPEYFVAMKQFIHSYAKVDIKLAETYFNEIEKQNGTEKALITISNLCFTLLKINCRGNENVDQSVVNMFKHPFGYSPKILDASDFQFLMEQLKTDQREIYPKIIIGTVITDGEIEGFLYAKDFNSELVVAQKSDYGNASEIAVMELDGTIVYQESDYLEHIIPHDLILDFDPGTFKANGQTHSNYEHVEELEKFNVGKDPEKEENSNTDKREQKHQETKGDIKLIPQESKSQEIAPAPSEPALVISLPHRPSEVQPLQIHHCAFKLDGKNRVIGVIMDHIPFAFDSEDDKKKHVATNGKFIKGLTLQRYNAFSIALKVLADICYIRRPIYPIMYYEVSNVEGFCQPELGIIAANLYNWIQEDVYEMATYLINLSAHELAHFPHKNHGKKHEAEMERIIGRSHRRLLVNNEETYLSRITRDELKAKIKINTEMKPEEIEKQKQINYYTKWLIKHESTLKRVGLSEKERQGIENKIARLKEKLAELQSSKPEEDEEELDNDDD